MSHTLSRPLLALNAVGATSQGMQAGSPQEPERAGKRVLPGRPEESPTDTLEGSLVRGLLDLVQNCKITVRWFWCVRVCCSRHRKGALIPSGAAR